MHDSQKKACSRCFSDMHPLNGPVTNRSEFSSAARREDVLEIERRDRHLQPTVRAPMKLSSNEGFLKKMGAGLHLASRAAHVGGHHPHQLSTIDADGGPRFIYLP